MYLKYKECYYKLWCTLYSPVIVIIVWLLMFFFIQPYPFCMLLASHWTIHNNSVCSLTTWWIPQIKHGQKKRNTASIWALYNTLPGPLPTLSWRSDHYHLFWTLYMWTQRVCAFLSLTSFAHIVGEKYPCLM